METGKGTTRIRHIKFLLLDNFINRNRIHTRTNGEIFVAKGGNKSFLFLVLFGLAQREADKKKGSHVA